MSIQHLANFFIRGGKLVVESIDKTKSIESAKQINDDGYYYIEFVNQKLKINNENQGEIALDRKKVENAKIVLGFSPSYPKVNFTGGLKDIMINSV